MPRRRSAALALAAVLAASALVAAAHAAPFVYPMPDGTTRIADERDIAPFEAAWKANALAAQRAAYRPLTANQQQWDARWYDLNLTFTPSSSVAGTVRMKATVVTGPISSVDLDMAAALTVDAATSAGFAATSSHVGDVLTLNLDRAYANGETIDVTVTYHGNPTLSGYFGFNIVNGRQLIWSLSEAYGAHTWWPCKDDNADKADSVAVHFTCPIACTTVSNGTLISRVNGSTTATTSWSERYPIAPYLVSIASYPYTITDDWYRPTPTDSMLVRFHNYPESAAGYAANQAKVKNMIAAFALKFGAYPFLAEKYGHAQFQFSGGMEHQTCTSLGVNNEAVMAHELAHQWWGDLATCHSFAHIWLNEGFATYGEAIWQESLGGLAAYQADIAADKYLGPGTVFVADSTNETRVFDSNLSYNKGAWVLHMLRHVMGDALFFTALQQYHTTWGYRSPTTENFRDLCESVCGRDLDKFFNEWVYGEYYPIYKPTWTAAAGGGGYDVTLTLQQTQSWQLFHMPVDVTISTTGGDQAFVVWDSTASQQFVLHVGAAPTALAIDKDDWILKTTQTVVTNPTFQKSLLLVNGVSWADYGAEITNAYANSAFSGAYPIDFWDTFAGGPVGGYPAPLPAPLGHGKVPPEVLAQYRNVIWVGNNFSGDLSYWQDSPMLSYLHAGGNLLLLSRLGADFLGDSLKAYLGINWISSSTTLNDCVATRPGLVNMSLLSTQNLCAVFDTVRTSPESQLLFKVSSGFTPNRGIGAIRMPASGAGYRPYGGRFAFISGRPYRWNATQLKSNVTTILTTYFREPLGATAVGEGGALAAHAVLEAARPNPSTELATLRFTLPRAAHARLVLVDVAGRRTRTLIDGLETAGPHEVSWDGRDERGLRVAAGLYWARLEAGGETAVRRLVRLP